MIYNIKERPWNYNDVEYWVNPKDLCVNAIINYNGKNTRLRAGIIILRCDEILLCEEEGEPGVFSLPGGGLEYGETPVDAAVREAKEEVNINVINAIDTQYDYCECHDEVKDWVRDNVPESNWWYNYYTCLVVGTYGSAYTGNVDPEDKDFVVKSSAKWYKINDVINDPSFKDQWKKAINFYRSLNKQIYQVGNKWQVNSQSGVSIGLYDNREDAEKGLRSPEYLNNLNEGYLSRQELIAGLKDLGYEYNYPKYSDAALFMIYQKALEKERQNRAKTKVVTKPVIKEPEEDKYQQLSIFDRIRENYQPFELEDEKTRIRDVLDQVKDIEYGFISQETGEKITDRDWIHNNDLSKIYKTELNPEVTLKNKLGICKDQAIAIKYLMNKFHPEDKVYLYALTTDEIGHCVPCYCHNDKWYYIENSWDNEKGLHGYFDSKDELEKYLQYVYYKNHKEDNDLDDKNDVNVKILAESYAPKYLYHATYKPFLKSILEKGLGNTRRKMWSDSKGKGTVYLSLAPEVAYSYAESAEWLDEVEDYDKYADNIIVLKIDSSRLDKDKIFIDENVLDNDGSTVEYYGIINKDAIVDIVDEQGKSLIINKKLTEATRAQLTAKSRNADQYKYNVRGKNRFERKKYSKVENSVAKFNTIDMNDFFKKDLLTINIPVVGETNNYEVTIQMDGVVAEIARNIKSNGNKFEYRTCVQALTKVFNTANIKVHCTCDDFKYRYQHALIISNDNTDGTDKDPGPGRTGMANTQGKGCKHVLLCLANMDWIMKVASVIKNYISYMDEHKHALFIKVIFPKLFNITADEAENKGLVPTGVDLETDKNTIETINAWSKNRGKIKAGTNVNPAKGKGSISAEKTEESDSDKK